MSTDEAHVIEGVRLRCLIANARRLLRRQYRTSPLWALVSDLTGHGATVSGEICRQCGYDPMQLCGTKDLQPPKI